MSKAFKEQSSADYKPVGPKSRTNWLEIAPTAPPPKTPLALYRLLSPTAGVRVSPICLGTMSIGNQWTGYMGGQALDQAGADKYMDAYVEAGGNFIDTANNYQDEQSEHMLGEWMEKRGNRNDLVIATKYTTYPKIRGNEPYPGIRVNYAGNHKKSLVLSVEESLRRLRTNYIDLLYVHWWDYTTSIPELMQSLNDLVRSGKVLYLGVSDTPAWIVSQANEYARQHGMATFVVYQGLWSLLARDIERDIIPMCRSNGMALAPWGVFGGGKFKTPEELKSRASLRGAMPPSEEDLKVAQTLTDIAKEIGPNVQPAHVAMAWCRSIMTDCWPILGGISIDNLKSNIEALDIKLTPEQMNKLDQVAPFNPGFPASLFGSDPRGLPDHKPNSFLLASAAQIQMSGYPHE